MLYIVLCCVCVGGKAVRYTVEAMARVLEYWEWHDVMLGGRPMVWDIDRSYGLVSTNMFSTIRAKPTPHTTAARFLNLSQISLDTRRRREDTPRHRT